ncbi:lytic transglycosylase domain-containing protein [Corticibacterium sp. UT-5YL-CI-8]|nr:lytic transglycosylase domain-containing protein [Tianweitania sp. UT-5YL-CI-8]
MAYRDGGACAAVPSIIAILIACTVIVAMAAPASAEQSPGEPAATVGTARGGTPDRAPAAAPSPDPWTAHIAEAAKRFDIPERWIRAVMSIESVGDPGALSPKGAIGLMQVMPATWAELRAKHNLGSDPWQPRDNILAGTAYLREMHDRYGSVAAMLAAYNAGPARYDAHLATGRALPAETIDYVVKITPMIDGTISIARSVGSASRPAWSRAPLFVARSTVRPDDDPAVADLPSGRPSNGQPIVDLSALVPSSNDLFVRRPETEGETR